MIQITMTMCASVAGLGHVDRVQQPAAECRVHRQHTISPKYGGLAKLTFHATCRKVCRGNAERLHNGAAESPLLVSFPLTPSPTWVQPLVNRKTVQCPPPHHFALDTTPCHSRKGLSTCLSPVKIQPALPVHELGIYIQEHSVGLATHCCPQLFNQSRPVGIKRCYKAIT